MRSSAVGAYVVVLILALLSWILTLAGNGEPSNFHWLCHLKLRCACCHQLLNVTSLTSLQSWEGSISSSSCKAT